MKRCATDQQEIINNNNFNPSVNLTSEAYTTSSDVPVSISHANRLTYQQTVAAPLVKTAYLVSEQSGGANTGQSNASQQVFQAASNLNNIRSQGFLPEPTSTGTKIVSCDSTKFKPEAAPRTTVSVNVSAPVSETMQTSVQTFPPQIQSSFQIQSVQPSNQNGTTNSVSQSMAPNVTPTSQPAQTQAHQQHQMHQNQAHHTTAQAPASQQQFQRLKVEDALWYLDKVKYKFGNQPQVYNDFLDIMKEFKSQSIDTPGVISRVSNLFKGHPELIVGFNTFLPLGYKIEVQSNEQVNVSVPGSGTPTIIHPGNPSATQQSSTFYAAVGAEVVKRLMMFQAPPVTNVHSNQSERSGGGAVTGNGLQQFNQSTAPLSPISSHNSSSPHQSSNTQTSQSQPVEFNHAINYVNKIKNRFNGQPDIYKQFLDILHTYQKEQRNLKEGISPNNKPLTESEVYSQVAKLFQNQEDLLQEFGQFLPDANGAVAATIPLAKAIENDHASAVKKLSTLTKISSTNNNSSNHQPNRSNPPMKRPSSLSQLQNKKPKIGTQKDISLAEAGKYGTLTEYAYFDKVRKALRNPDVYDNFLRCLVLFNKEVISRSELVHLVTPFLGKFPELFKWFKDFVGHKELGTPTMEPIPNRIASQERMGADWEMEVDYSSCKRYGASYRALPKTYVQPKCSGRTALCKEVLNDTYVSFPTWSEDSTFVSSRKTQFEEYIYRCEDERFELDVVLETNLATIKILEAVQKKMNRMSSEDASKFRLDESLGGTSQVIHQRSIRRIYGDKCSDIIDGLKRNPLTAVPVVLKRLKNKEEEWREAQKGFNKIWRDQNEKYYLKSLDHQGITFKQNDIRYLRSKNFLNEIEMLYEERHDQMEDGVSNITSGPHVTLTYKDKSILDDATNLIIHHVKRLTGVHKEDKQKMKQILKQVIPDIFFHSRQELSDDECDKDDDMDVDDASSNDGNKRNSSSSPSQSTSSSTSHSLGKETTKNISEDMSDSSKCQESINKNFFPCNDSDEAYHLMFGNNNWYLFFRLHYILCERLTKMYHHAIRLAEEEAKEKSTRKEATSRALRLQPKQDYDVEEYYPALLDMVKCVLDGNLENTQFEDTLRDMYGIHAYISFSLDKVVINIVRQLQHLACDEICIQCTELYQQEVKQGGAGGSCATALQRTPLEVAYQRKAEQKMSDENCYKIYIYKNETKLAIELLDTDSDESEDPVEVEKWSDYVEKYVDEDNMSEELREQLSRKPVFLPRNVRTWRQRAKKRNLSRSEEKKQIEKSDSSDEMTDKNDNDNDKAVDDMDILDNTECKFNISSFKMVFVVNSESYLYKHFALQRAAQSHKRVSTRLNSKFRMWHNKWVSENVATHQEKQSSDWMMGKIDGLVPNHTRCLDNNDLNKPPYSTYNRYKVDLPGPGNNL